MSSVDSVHEVERGQYAGKSAVPIDDRRPTHAVANEPARRFAQGRVVWQHQQVSAHQIVRGESCQWFARSIHSRLVFVSTGYARFRTMSLIPITPTTVESSSATNR